jgi:hypothetical protein
MIPCFFQQIYASDVENTGFKHQKCTIIAFFALHIWQKTGKYDN